MPLQKDSRFPARIGYFPFSRTKTIYCRKSSTTTSGWWFQPNLSEKYEWTWESSPFSGWTLKKYLSCHHLVAQLQPLASSRIKVGCQVLSLRKSSFARWINDQSRVQRKKHTDIHMDQTPIAPCIIPFLATLLTVLSAHLHRCHLVAVAMWVRVPAPHASNPAAVMIPRSHRSVPTAAPKRHDVKHWQRPRGPHRPASIPWLPGCLSGEWIIKAINGRYHSYLLNFVVTWHQNDDNDFLWTIPHLNPLACMPFAQRSFSILNWDSWRPGEVPKTKWGARIFEVSKIMKIYEHLHKLRNLRTPIIRTPYCLSNCCLV